MKGRLPARRLKLAALSFSAAWLGALAAPAQAGQSLAAIRHTAEQALHAHFALPGSRVEISSSALDSRLQLATCEVPLRANIPDSINPSSRVSVTVQCPQAGGWTLRVPVQMKLFRQVLVTNQPLLRGDGIRANDVHAEERDITRLGYGHLERLDQVMGRVLARPLASGSVLTPSALGGRRMIRAGDNVQMIARLNGIEVRADGVALGSGDNGARVRVRNANSGRIIDTMVSAPGVVVTLP